MYTKTEWMVYDGEKGIEIHADNESDAGSVIVADVVEGDIGIEEAKANAERICLCVNSHDELVKQRDELLEACRDALLIRSKMYAVQYHSGSSFDFKIYLLEVDLENEVIEIDKRIREAIATAEKQGS